MQAKEMVVLGMLAAVAFVLMAAVQFPLLPQAPFLKYDPSDAVALLAGVLYGPLPGVSVVLVKDLLFLLLRARGPFGPAADFVAAATFVAVTAWGFRRLRGSFASRLLRAALLGTLARVAIMIPTNFVVLALQFGMSPPRVAGLLLPAIIPFNAVKALLNAAVALVIAGPFLRSAPPEVVPEGEGRR